MDPQSRAYREATASDQFDGDFDALGAAVHEPITELAQVRMPGEYEADGWDTDRLGPKSVGEARAALAARIADPTAPDTEAEAGAYGEGAS